MDIEAFAFHLDSRIFTYDDTARDPKKYKTYTEKILICHRRSITKIYDALRDKNPHTHVLEKRKLWR